MMTSMIRSRMGHRMYGVLIMMTALLWALPLTAVPAEKGPNAVAGLSHEEAMRLGAMMYVQGILPSGAPMQGMVQGDIPVDGSKFTCANCHQRSGFGSLEGTIRTPPVDGTRLYAPLSKFKGVPLYDRSKAAATGAMEVYREAYTDETLARVMRTGEDPAGKQIFNTMPKYFLDDRDMAILVYYLKNLSTGLESGVTETELRFATVIAGEVAGEDREAMLGPLRAFVSRWRISRNMERMSRRDAFVQEGESRGLRKITLSVWELKGPVDTWRAQLEEQYRKAPVFALLGGISSGDWEPIHRFCEDRKIPAIFPVTDFPVISDTDWYTLYLSRGLYQEGETAARYLNSSSDAAPDRSVVQVFRKDRAGLALAKAFRETWKDLGRSAVEDFAVEKDQQLTPRFWENILDRKKPASIVLWLNPSDIPDLGRVAKQGSRPALIILSSSLLKKDLYSLPEEARAFVYVTYPYTLPRESQPYKASIETSLKINNIPMTNLDIEYKMFSLFSTLTGPFTMLRNFVYRDYFLELIESTPDQASMPVVYPRLSFGAGQRYASKGCYIVQLSEGRNPELIKRSDWVIH